MNIVLYALAGFTVLGTISSVLLTGKPGGPTSYRYAAVTVISAAVYVTILIIAAGQLH